jgi:LPXTG-motif cell wall-anchored protein
VAGFLPAPTNIRRPVDLGFSLAIVGLGLVMVGFFAWLRRRRRRHEEAVRQVVPLAGDRCPLCAVTLAPAVRPYCAACEVDVLTR